MKDRKQGYYECSLKDGKNRILYWNEDRQKWTSSGSEFEFEDDHCLSICEIEVRDVSTKLRFTLDEIEAQIKHLESIDYNDIDCPTLEDRFDYRNDCIEEIKKLLAR